MAKVAIVELHNNVQQSFEQALKLVRKADYCKTLESPVVIKVGAFNHKGPRTNHPTVDAVDAVELLL